MDTALSAGSYFMFLIYLLWAVWLVQTRRGAASQCLTAAVLCAGVFILWKWIGVVVMVAGILITLGALSGLILLVATAGESADG